MNPGGRPAISTPKLATIDVIDFPVGFKLSAAAGWMRMTANDLDLLREYIRDKRSLTLQAMK
jgi:hypothetical protein